MPRFYEKGAAGAAVLYRPMTGSPARHALNESLVYQAFSP
jgi:hypothetical protein